MNSRSSKLTEDLVKSASEIREKFRALKRGKFIDEEQRIEMFKPITNPLEKLSNLSNFSNFSTPAIQAQQPSIRTATPSKIPAIQGRPPPLTLQFGKTAAKYLSNYMMNKSITDTTYGLRKDDDDPNNFKIGNENAEIASDDIIIAGAVYKGTEGLWELLTLKKPVTYTQDDLNTYKDILIKTDAHKKSYNPDAQISSNSGSKYTKIIGPLFKDKTGEGLREVTNNKVDHIYWNNPNELINRLRLLILSRDAGNTGVNNEIESIIEELREEKIIY